MWAKWSTLSPRMSAYESFLNLIPMCVMCVLHHSVHLNDQRIDKRRQQYQTKTKKGQVLIPFVTQSLLLLRFGFDFFVFSLLLLSPSQQSELQTRNWWIYTQTHTRCWQQSLATVNNAKYTLYRFFFISSSLPSLPFIHLHLVHFGAQILPSSPVNSVTFFCRD